MSPMTKKEFYEYISNSEISLRDYFAGQALRGIFDDNGLFSQRNKNAVAQRCYEIADAMLEKRSEYSE